MKKKLAVLLALFLSFGMATALYAEDKETEKLESRIKNLEKEVSILKSTEEIKKLQRAYGYYLEHFMIDDLVDLFSDSPDATLLILNGEFKGKKSIRGFFDGVPNTKDPHFLHQVMQLSGIVNIEPDGITAKGRWYGFGANSIVLEEGVTQAWMNGIYENEYIYEEGRWKIKKVRWCTLLMATPNGGWVEPSKQIEFSEIRNTKTKFNFHPDGPPEKTMYPSGFITPFHFKNPVSGK